MGRIYRFGRQDGAALAGRAAMPNDLSIKAVAAVTGASENPAEPQPEAFIPPANGPPAAPALPMPNPQLRLDPALGLVVIEFRDEKGVITTSIPSRRQLEAYRMWEKTPPDAPALPGRDVVQPPPGAPSFPTARPPITDPTVTATGVHNSATLKA